MTEAVRIYRPGEVGPRLTRAAQYLRMSTGHQRYSTENQKAVLGSYAAEHGMILVKTYWDRGRSGLTLRGRPALQMLLEEVASGKAGYDVILVYDVSRWGRFQDTDESATYEFLCRCRGVDVIYCNEPFPQGDAPLVDLLKTVKRSMAGEFSRDLSEKSYRGHLRLASMGYHQGSSAPYGMRRMRVNERGEHLAAMQKGQSKALSTDRVILVPGPAAEQRTIRGIFRQFAEQKHSMPKIAAALNASGIRNAAGRSWHKQEINRILHNERYIGTYLWNQTSERLKSRRRRNEQALWVRLEGAIAPIVSRDLWERARQRLKTAADDLPKEQMLRLLQKLLHKRGTLSSALIAADDELPSSKAYVRLFGSLQEAYRAIGYVPQFKPRWHESYYRNGAIRKRVMAEILQGLHVRGFSLQTSGRLLSVDGSLRIAIVTACHQKARSGHSRWVFRRHGYQDADVLLVIRMDKAGERLVDYYLLPNNMFSSCQCSVATLRSAAHERYRIESLKTLFELLEKATTQGEKFLGHLQRWRAEGADDPRPKA
jgi:DNA invertase Pin-like site-specific DNA recombinase